MLGRLFWLANPALPLNMDESEAREAQEFHRLAASLL